MATKEKIQKAMEMINDFDFAWRMSNFAYSNGLDKQAQNQMRTYSNFIHSECNNFETPLRQLWIAYYSNNQKEIERLKNLLPTI